MRGRTFYILSEATGLRMQSNYIDLWDIGEGFMGGDF